MLKIRLARTGKKKQASYRVVVADKDSRRDGRVVERIGYYNPLPNPADYRIKEERALYWLTVGAQPTDAVRILLEKQGTLARLARFHAGETLESLVAEFNGPTEAASPAQPKAAVAVEETVVSEAAPAEAVVAETAAEAEAAVETSEETAVDEHVDAAEVVEAETAADTTEAEATEEVEAAGEAETVAEESE